MLVYQRVPKSQKHHQKITNLASPRKSLAMFSLTVLPRGTLSTALCLLLLRLSRRSRRLQRGLWALLPFLAGAHKGAGGDGTKQNDHTLWLFNIPSGILTVAIEIVDSPIKLKMGEFP